MKQEEGAVPEEPPPVPAEPPPNAMRLALEVICALLLVALFLLLLGSALLRNRGYTAPAVYEVIRVTFVYMVGLAALVAFARRVNLCVPGWWRKESVSYQAAMLVLSATLTFLTFQMLFGQGFGPDAASLLGLPEGTMHIPIGLFATGLTVLSAARLRAAVGRGHA